jgi:hypothetical protein
MTTGGAAGAAAAAVGAGGTLPTTVADAARQAEMDRLRREGLRTYELTVITSDIKWVLLL